jgi:hypothetical protein
MTDLAAEVKAIMDLNSTLSAMDATALVMKYHELRAGMSIAVSIFF